MIPEHFNRPEMVAARRAGMDRRRDERIESYREMRSAGMSHKRIAAIEGISVESLMRWLHRVGVYVPEAQERPTYRRLDELIASGRDFTARDLPDDSPDQVHTAAILRAVHAGRIEKVGRARHRGVTGSYRLNIYRATAQEDSCLRTA